MDTTGEVVIEDEDQRCRTIVDGGVWLCGPAFQLVRNARASFETVLQGFEGCTCFK